MSSPAEPSEFVLVRRLADGSVEWIPLDSTPAHVPAAGGAEYALIERGAYEAPKTLDARRAGTDLVVEVEGKEALVLDGFFDAPDIAFYPTTNIAGGAGPFSGPTVTASSLGATAPGGEQVVWSAVPPVSAEATAGGGSGSVLGWVGVGAGVLAVGALAGGGGGSGGGSDTGGGSQPPSDSTPPQITSGPAAPTVVENSGPGQVVYTATATDAATVTYGLKAGNDAAAFSINATSGAVTLAGNPDFESKSSYAFTVTARDVAGNTAEQSVTLNVGNVDEVAPTITSPGSVNVNENSGSGRVVYTATSTDTGDISTGSTTYSLKPGGDASSFTINGSTGAVTLTGNPDFETMPSYNFTVVATDAAGNASERAVSLRVVDSDDPGPPTLTSVSPADGQEDVPVDTNIVLTFSETVLAGDEQIELRGSRFGDNLTIDADDTTQVTISGNRVTINPTSDLNPDTEYEVRIDRGAFTDLAGNPFAGLGAGNAPSFDTVNEDDLEGSGVDEGRSFAPGGEPVISIASAVPDRAADSGSETWDGSIELGSDERILLVAGVEVEDDEAADSGRDAALSNTAMSAQSTAGALLTSGGGHANPMHLELATVIVTSQGLA